MVKGRASYRRGIMYFDAVGWAMVKAASARAHRTPTQIVTAAIKRRAKLEKSQKS